MTPSLTEICCTLRYCVRKYRSEYLLQEMWLPAACCSLSHPHVTLRCTCGARTFLCRRFCTRRRKRVGNRRRHRISSGFLHRHISAPSSQRVIARSSKVHRTSRMAEHVCPSSAVDCSASPTCEWRQRPCRSSDRFGRGGLLPAFHLHTTAARL